MIRFTIDTKKRNKYNLVNFDKLKDTNPDCETISCNSYYIKKDSTPIFFNSAEFHYFRTPQKYWEEEILKLKASGINMISSVVPWIMHEEKENVFNFKNHLDIKYFIELCKKHNLYFCLRLGPYIHAELINGGLPQWLMEKPIKTRSNNEGYLFYAKRYLDNLLFRVDGLFYNQGGPIVAIYLENELDEGPEHLEFLKKYITACGYNAPIYFFTSMPYEFDWYKEAIPTGGTYPFPTWGSDMTAMLSSGNYLFTNSCKIYHEGYEAYSIANKTPYALTEIGSGIMTSKEIRPLVPPNAISALTAVKLASGCNFINYFMYHGGINPHPNGDYYFGDDISPEMSYDFQAPIGEFGQMREMNKHLKIISLFINEFGSDIAPLSVCLQENNDKITENNITDLRYAARSDGNKGYLFINNYQDHLVPTNKSNLQFDIILDDEVITFPKYKLIDIASEDYAILPFNMNINGITIKYATAQPVTTIKDNNITYLIMTTPFNCTYAEFCFDINTIETIKVEKEFSEIYDNATIVIKNYGNNSMKVTSKNGEVLVIKTIKKEEALNLWKLKINDKDQIIISDLQLTNNENDISLIIKKSGKYKFKVFPAINQNLILDKKCVTPIINNDFSEYNLPVNIQSVNGVHYDINNDNAKITINDDILSGYKEVFLEIDYKGDMAKAFIGDKLILDNFYHNEKWQIGLDRYLNELQNNNLYIKIYPKKDEQNNNSCSIKSIQCFGIVEQRLVFEKA